MKQRILDGLRRLVPGMAAFAADQGLKAALWGKPRGVPLFQLGGLVEIVPVVNTGAAFSMLAGHPWVLTALGLILLGLLACWLGRRKTFDHQGFWLSLLLGGGTGNWLDRLLRGGVLDYVRLLPVRFPIFNLADICITVSAFGLAFTMLAGEKKEA